MLNNGLDIWKELVRCGLEESRANGLPGYDEELVRTLKNHLYPKSTRSLSLELQSNPPSTELFLEAFFAALKPFSKMLSDVLYMFENAGARRSDENLRISFAFDKASNKLALTLQQFREVETFFRQITRPILERLWTTDTLWSLREDVQQALKIHDTSFTYYNRQHVHNECVAQWIKDNGRPSWLLFPGFPRSGNCELDRTLGMAENLINYMISELLQLGATYQEFATQLHELPWEEHDESFENISDKDDKSPRRNFVQAAHDFWPNSFAEIICYGVETVNNNEGENKTIIAEQLASAIQSGFDRPPRRERTVESIEHDFRELINLPIWKKRHELYAVWVASRISEALGSLSWEWHPDGDTLRFPFCGVELATFRSSDGNTHIFWTEKRTALSGSGFFGRKNIQPDYRIMTVPTHRNEATTLVVECKQYRKWSRKNFGAALDDYTKGCPAATVILVNYGPVDASILNLVDPSRRDRAFLIGDFKPGEDSAIDNFRALVRTAYAIPLQPRIAEGIKIELNWGSMFQDLDLHLFIKPIDTEIQHIGYGAISGSLTEPPWVEWPKDVRSSPPGSEKITIARWLNADYDILVHDYTGSNSFPQGDIRVRVIQDSGIEKSVFVPLRSGVGRWWYVCRIHGDTGIIEEINSIHSECPVQL